MWWSKAKAFQANRPAGWSAAATLSQVQQRPERAVNQRRRLVQGQLAHVTLAQVQLDACRGRPGPGQLEHRRRGIDADDWLAGRLRDRDGDPPVADRELDQRPG